VLVVDEAPVDNVCTAGAVVDDNGVVVDGTALVERAVVPVVIIVVVGRTHAIIPTVT
jgi:hypothetical protein